MADSNPDESDLTDAQGTAQEKASSTRIDLPKSVAEATARMARAPIPGPVHELARSLQAAGYETVVVGGAVRDALLEREHGDWDVATSATPEEVKTVFSKTIDTGLAHGTVTVMVGRGAERTAVEVTTYRGDGEYLDGRRPQQVTFHRSLKEDLARRDFTINALAYDPVARVFHDPFDGLEDLRAGRVRAVGDAMRRFTEDGLRPIRGLRFCATLGFVLEPATFAAIEPCLPIFRRVSRERVWVELLKLLSAPQPSLGLVPMRACGMWSELFPVPTEFAAHGGVDSPRPQDPSHERAWDQCLHEVDALARDPILRLARLLQGDMVGADEVGAEGREKTATIDLSPEMLHAVESLKPSREQRSRLVVLAGPRVLALQGAQDPQSIRRAAAAIGREHILDAIALVARSRARHDDILVALQDAPLSVRELAVRGQDLLDAGLAERGPGLGQTLAALHAWALEDPSRNSTAALMEQAARLSAPGA